MRCTIGSQAKSRKIMFFCTEKLRAYTEILLKIRCMMLEYNSPDRGERWTNRKTTRIPKKPQSQYPVAIRNALDVEECFT